MISQSLLEGRLPAAQKEQTAVSGLLEQGAGGTEDFIGATKRVLEARLGLANGQEQRMAAYEDALEVAESFEQRAKPLVGQLKTVSELARIQYWVTDLKVRRLRLQEEQN